MKKLVFESKGKRIVFDDFTDERDQDYCGVWAGMCKEFAKKYRDILVDDSCDRLDDCGSGTCGVEGCNNEADYYVDFWIDDNIKIVDDEIEEKIKAMNHFDYAYRIGKTVSSYDITNGKEYGSSWGLTDLYPECKENLQALLASSENFRATWDSKHELLSATIMRIDGVLMVDVYAWMDDLWDSGELIYDAVYEAGGSEDMVLSDETIEEIRSCLSDECDDHAGESWEEKCDMPYEELMTIIDDLTTYCEARLDTYFAELVNVVSHILNLQKR